MPEKKSIVKALRAARAIVIMGHINPDGDSIGSSLALAAGLRAAGKDVTVVSPGGIPARYRFLPGARAVVSDTPRTFDLAVAVDVGDERLLGGAAAIFARARESAEIDHHSIRRRFAGISLIDTRAASVGIVVYKLLKKMRVPIGHDIAVNLLTSIIVETNSFRQPSVTPETFTITAELIRQKIDFAYLAHRTFWAKTQAAAVLQGIVLERMAFRKRGKLAFSLVTRRDLRTARARDEDADSIADEIRTIEGVKAVILFRETAGGAIRVGLRSNGNVNIGKIARRFNGGGHYDVAGCEIENAAARRAEIIRAVEKIV